MPSFSHISKHYINTFAESLSNYDLITEVKNIRIYKKSRAFLMLLKI